MVVSCRNRAKRCCLTHLSHYCFAMIRAFLIIKPTSVLNAVVPLWALGCGLAVGLGSRVQAAQPPVPSQRLGPVALAVAPDGTKLYIAGSTAQSIAIFDPVRGSIVQTLATPGAPSGLTLDRQGKVLVVTCAAPSSRVCWIDAVSGKTLQSMPVGHTAMSPVLSRDGKTLYVCNRFENTISVIDVASQRERMRLPVSREPFAADLTPDGKTLLVAHHLHAGRADADVVAATVSIIDTDALKVVKTLALPNGSGLLRGMRISPDGKYACVTHVLGRFHLPTTQLDRGWMNSNALSIIDLSEMKLLNTVLLDNVDSGAANPWALGWTGDGKTLAVTHAGTHELSVIDWPALLDKLGKLPATEPTTAATDYSVSSRWVGDVPNDLAFMVGLRQRIKLHGKGPRALALSGNRVFVAHYFSDSLEVVNLAQPPLKAVALSLGAKAAMSVTQRGEMLFNDASICFQGWQSCASCHSEDARVDGMNWDLLNDGIGNPKNVKSLLLVHRTPPVMSLGVRDTAETAVRAGIRSILFTVQPEETAVAIDEWLKSLKPMPSPRLVNGKLSAAAKRGQKLFNDSKVGCARCHPPGLFTDLKNHDVGTRGKFDQATDLFDTPTLIELWRTAPYLHDGSAVTVRDVLTTANPTNQHGDTLSLTPPQIEDLVDYLLSL